MLDNSCASRIVNGDPVAATRATWADWRCRVTRGTIALQTVVSALEQLTDEQGAFLNPSTGEIVVLTNDELYAVEREEESASLELTPERIARARAVIESEEFTFLPTCFDINEQRIQEDFCSSLADES